MIDMCKYVDGSPVFPYDDVEYDRLKSQDFGEWRLATVKRNIIFSGYSKDDTCIILGYGRVTVLLQYPAEEFHEFAMWPTEQEPNTDWDIRDIHWEHTWQYYTAPAE